MVNLAMRARLDGDVVRDVRIAAGGIAATSVRLTAIERALDRHPKVACRERCIRHALDRLTVNKKFQRVAAREHAKTILPLLADRAARRPVCENRVFAVIELADRVRPIGVDVEQIAVFHRAVATHRQAIAPVSRSADVASGHFIINVALLTAVFARHAPARFLHVCLDRVLAVGDAATITFVNGARPPAVLVVGEVVAEQQVAHAHARARARVLRQVNRERRVPVNVEAAAREQLSLRIHLDVVVAGQHDKTIVEFFLGSAVVTQHPRLVVAHACFFSTVKEHLPHRRHVFAQAVVREQCVDVAAVVRETVAHDVRLELAVLIHHAAAKLQRWHLRAVRLNLGCVMEFERGERFLHTLPILFAQRVHRLALDACHVRLVAIGIAVLLTALAHQHFEIVHRALHRTPQ
ncbi:MAG: hypothetical protein LC737_01445 [Chloroflexi bacterium]|nr:hypothetical protein [Chloroflexota bacterium]